MENKSSILLLRKPPGVTSFASLFPIKHLVSPHVGHAGTLDKFADGLMIVLTGKLTRLNPVFSGLDKKYRAVFHFGRETDTLDPEGDVVAEAPVPDEAIIREAINSGFLGTVMQRPPAFSAIHVGGERAHRLVRSGRPVDIPERPVTIHSFNVVSWEPPFLTADIHVSKGTYIRSIARDLGHACASHCFVQHLTRTAIGPYTLEEAVTADDYAGIWNLVGEADRLLLRLSSCGVLRLEDEDMWNLTAAGTMPLATLHGKNYAIAYDRKGIAQAVLAIDSQGRCTKALARFAG
ncbi:tRNA pseudouridine(55) synthase TruB [Parasphaerochaeta coccoides]|uniref:tRNA pseudouridine synthase B n=1 Tax=Parasphaerochaeta coccoides (strain ATCC BAA-1237 / DSM 17374 / SPN1) TaxID=760011 RepID=F4GK52_PARC1|nr:tRNA pseudouridine(55) synthase TruB [Parasphaerochaeta coccoides]AEC01824.1 tRNA pseudouridine synthase B [Parasphaerochaeta coccoides DSM 17374]